MEKMDQLLKQFNYFKKSLEKGFLKLSILQQNFKKYCQHLFSLHGFDKLNHKT